MKGKINDYYYHYYKLHVSTLYIFMKGKINDYYYHYYKLHVSTRLMTIIVIIISYMLVQD